MAQLKSTNIFGTIKVHSLANSISKTSGSVVVSGGVGINKTLYVGENLFVLGNATLTGAINGLTITPVPGKTLDLSVASFKSGSGTNTGSVTITSDSTTARTITVNGNPTLVEGTMVPTTRTIAGKPLGSNVTLNSLSVTTPLAITANYNGSANQTISLADGYGDTKNPYGSKAAKYFLASPNGSAGVPSFRTIVASDIPTLNQNTTGNAATASKVNNSITFNNVGNGASSGATFDGSTAGTISYNTIGASPLAGSTNITTLGTITSGTWSASTIAVDKGGTGATTFTANALLKGNGASTITASAVVDDSVAETITLGRNTIISGNLTVNGTTITVNSTTTTLKDPVITLGGNTDLTESDGKDRGIEYRWFSGTAKKGFFGLDKSAGKFTFIPDATNENEVFTGDPGIIVANLEGNASTVTNGVYTTGSYSDPSWLSISKTKVGLGNVENTKLSTWAGSSFITKLGTIATGTWKGGIVGSAYGGTGVNNAYTLSITEANKTIAGTASTLTLNKNLTVQTGNLTLTAGASGTTATFPASGSITLVDTATTQTLTNKKLGSLTSNGFVKTSKNDGTLSVDTNTYLTGNQEITLSGVITGSGTTSISTSWGETPWTNYLPLTGGTISGGIIPNADNTIYLGSNEKLFSTIYTGTIRAKSALPNQININGDVLFIDAGYGSGTGIGSRIDFYTSKKGASSGATPHATNTHTMTADGLYVDGEITGTSFNDITGLSEEFPPNLAAAAVIGTSTLAAREDHVHKRPTLAELGIGNVENTRLSTWSGTANITTVGTVTANASDATNGVIYPLTLTRVTTAIPANGIGTGIRFITETAAGNEIGSTIESVTTDVASGTEDFDIVFKTMTSGSAASEAMRITSDKKIKIGGKSTLVNNGTSTVDITLPPKTGTLVGTGDTGTVTNAMLAGSIANDKLTNYTISGVSLGGDLYSLSAGTGLTWSAGTTYKGSSASTIALTSIASGSTTVGALKYNGTASASGVLYGGTTTPTSTTRLNYNGAFYATKVYGAVWNDIADFIEIDRDVEIEYGKSYYRDKNGKIRLTKKKGSYSIGIASDTYGFGVGQDGTKNQMPVAIGGWVLAYVDNIYKPGTPLVAGKNGILTKASLFIRVFKNSYILGHFDREEKEEEWNKLLVKKRHWIKIK